MKTKDLAFAGLILLLFVPFGFSESLLDAYQIANKEHGMLMSFLKFAILATTGEALGLRIKTGEYWYKGFGLLPRAIVWGFLGLTIKLAFVVFTKGTIGFLAYLGFADAPEAFVGPFTGLKIFVAFSISTCMNLIYAPIMMTLHKITDTHILANGGTVSSLLKPINFGGILSKIDWNIQWNFVFKKTIPFFWIPAHTITFLLPEEYQILFAALLGIALGVILALAGIMSKNTQSK
jgi:hypothetical protein